MRVRRLPWFVPLLTLLLAALATPAWAAELSFKTSDGVRLHLIEGGLPRAPTIVFVPGWAMPAWIFQKQIAAFSRAYHVIALDPRGQGDSETPLEGYTPARRGQDIGDLITALGNRPVLLVAWSLGVLDSLAYVQQAGDARLAGLVLIDNSIGEDPPPKPSALPLRRGPRLEREVQMRRFVQGMFRSAPGEAYLARLTDTALRTPPDVAARLASYGAPRSYWRDAVYSVRKPVLYVVRPRFAEQAANLAARHPAAETALFAEAGHALFVDEPARFDGLLQDFISRRVWP
jgi:microsomal epoxide hydrolase